MISKYFMTVKIILFCNKLIITIQVIKYKLILGKIDSSFSLRHIFIFRKVHS